MSRQVPGSPSRRLAAFLVVLLSVATAHSLAAQDSKSFSLGLGGMIGGPLDADDAGDPGLGNTGFAGHFAWRTQPKTRVIVHVASLDMGDELLGGLADSTLDFVTIGGEYLFQEPYYVSGFYFALGAYRLDGLVPEGAALVSEDETSIGISLGATGDFAINERFSVFGDVSFHYADLDGANLFGLFALGVAWHF